MPKLKYEHIHLTSFSRMRVDLAAQVHVISIFWVMEPGTSAPSMEGVCICTYIRVFFFRCLAIQLPQLCADKKKRGGGNHTVCHNI